MKIRSPFVHALAGLLGAGAVRAWMATLDYRAAFYDPSVDPPRSPPGVQRIYIFWHEYILAPLHMRGHCNLAMLVSRHGDAEILSRAARHLGFACVRGSTNRGGAAALRELFNKSRYMHLTITPDGPRGPRRRLAPGPVFLASKLGMPLVCMGLGYDRPWRLNSWDRFAVPRPGSRARAVVSPEIRLPTELDRDGLEHYRVQMERLLDRMTLEAEAWAEAGTRKICEERVLREPVRRPRRGRFDVDHPLAGPHEPPRCRAAAVQRPETAEGV